MQRKGIFKYLHGDMGIWLIVMLLSVFSILAVYSSTGTLAYRFQSGNTGYYVLKHALIMLFGWFLMYGAHLIPYNYYSRISQLLFIISVPLLLFTMLTGSDINGASRWMTLPIINLSFQTSDLAKLALVMYLARQLSKNKDKVNEPKTFFMILGSAALVCLLIFPENFSTSALLMTTSVVLMFFGGVNIRYMAGIAGAGIVAILILLTVFYTVPEESLPGRFSTWKNRIETFGGAGDVDANYQAEQAKIAVASGGFFGKLPGNSTQRNYLPHPYSDYIYAIIIEEYGMLGGMIILMFYLWFFYRGIRIARACEGTFGSYLVLGICFILTLQALINMAVAVDLFPVTGQPLPLLSMGGTALWFTAIGIGIVLSVSVAVEKKGEGKNIDESLAKVAN